MKKYIVFFFFVILALLLPKAFAHENPYKVFIDAKECNLYLLKNDVLIKTYHCAVGKESTPSPIGSWTINYKNRWGGGFGGSFMGINCPWGIFGIHGTTHPESIGWCASKGCIRMYNNDADELYRTIEHGTPVVIENGCFGAFGTGFREIRSGMYGADLMAIQKRLAELGYAVGTADGVYGESTRRAIHQYQKDIGLAPDDTISVDLIKSMGFILME